METIGFIFVVGGIAATIMSIAKCSISVWTTLFFTAWSGFNVYYFVKLDQEFVALAYCGLTVASFVWMLQTYILGQRQ